MRLCFIVDYRSPIARNWIAHFADRGHDVHVISTYPGADVQPGVASVVVQPLGLSTLAANPRLRRVLAARSPLSSDAPAPTPAPTPKRSAGGRLGRLGRRANDLATETLAWTTPVESRLRARSVARHVARLRPDVVHAMRIPYEGMLAAEALRGVDIPLVTSVWGNDFTLWAPKNPIIAAATRRALSRTTALHTDCRRDLRLAETWGWDPARPAVVLPGSGGIQLDLFHPGAGGDDVRARWDVPRDRPVIVNPRSFRPGYVRNDTFFAAIPLVLRDHPDACFVGVGMAGHPHAEAWRARPDVGHAIRLLPNVTRTEMADLFRLATVTVSPSMHDGTPNTLLEAMATGAFPVAGDIESVREWIDHGENGLLCDPGDPDALAAALGRALDDAALRRRAAERNRALVVERAEYGTVMRAAEEFYARVVAAGAHAAGVARRSAIGSSGRRGETDARAAATPLPAGD